MNNWTWGSACFGYRNGDRLFTHDGSNIGRFDGDELYGSDGRYLGEVRNSNCLITHRGKKHWRRSRFLPRRGEISLV